MAKTMVNETNVAKDFWAEAVNTTCYIQNRIFIRPILEKNPYELYLEITLAGSDEKTKVPEVSDKKSPDVTKAPSIQKKSRSHPNISEDLILGNKDEPIRTRSTFKVPKEIPLGLVSLIEPTSYDEALQDDDWCSTYARRARSILKG
ncbi:hypothetical protein KIW84_061777 [Lathyrus oleraceus]|uniref:Uncharacterized protein n=1 Tax=Pisum sativum TaxID=3888 RepID=A0A9D4W3D2_PEA|nr:hypothetical protein KIW84_061777 [Pisum sativum]